MASLVDTRIGGVFIHKLYLLIDFENKTARF